MLFSWSGNPDTSIDVFRWRGLDGWLNQHIYKVTPNEGVTEDFLFFLLRWLRPRFAEIARNKQTTGLGHVTLGDFKAIQVGLPSTDEQKAIVEYVKPIEDKIDLNRRMNNTLEAMARVLFKDWFVDFGPTRAKAEGRPPYLSSEVWELFPDKLDENDKPVGWQFGTLGSFACSESRIINPSDVNEDTPYIGLEHMPRRSVALTDWAGAGKVTSNKAAFMAGEFLFGKLRPYFHKVGVAPLNGICSTDIVVIRAKSPEWSAAVLVCISTDEFVEYTNQTSTGTKMPRTNWPTMAQYKMTLPPSKVARQYQALVQPLIDRIIANIHESRTLARTRDLLLPKLMSGEISLRDAEKIVEEAV